MSKKNVLSFMFILLTVTSLLLLTVACSTPTMESIETIQSNDEQLVDSSQERLSGYYEDQIRIAKINAKWQDNKWLGSRVSDYKNIGGAMYAKYNKGVIVYVDAHDKAYTLSKLIFARWTDLDRQNGVLKYPNLDVSPTASGSGRFNRFEGGYIIQKDSKAYSVYGGFLTHWAAQGWTTSFLGLPKSERYYKNGILVQNFEYGRVHWSDVHGTYMMWPVLTGNSGRNSNSSTIGVELKEASATGTRFKITGKGFTPGKRVQLYLNNPLYGPMSLGVVTVENNGTFIKTSYYMEHEFILKVNGYVTIMARESANKLALYPRYLNGVGNEYPWN